jgi:hypothetical protein
VLLPLLHACGGSTIAGGDPNGPADTVAIPLTEMGPLTYFGLSGGLYEGGNQVPSDHAALGLGAARAIIPRDAEGRPSASGKYVLLSIGMSNATQEFCAREGAQPCEPWTFMGQAAAGPTVNHTTLEIVNGAVAGATPDSWDQSTDPQYGVVRDRLASQGVSEQQVQIVWLKTANTFPTVSLPDQNAEAYRFERQLGDVVRTLKVRYPNLRQVFLSSRIFGGYARGVNELNPEPFAYEYGFSVKWLIQAQINQVRTGSIDGRGGPLGVLSAPWIAWGPYIWANGSLPRSDGLRWERADFEADMTHPQPSGEAKVGAMLLAFFTTSPFTRCWFVAGQTC